MKTKEEAFNYINKQEKSDISFCKIGSDCKNLIISFSGNGHDGYERKSSLVNHKYDNKNSNFDILLVRDRFHWYLGALNGIGNDVDTTVKFLKKERSNYDNVITTGSSAGGYASILFGSLLNVHTVIANVPQIDLEFVVNKSWPCSYKNKKEKGGVLWISKSVCGSKDYVKYKNLTEIMQPNINYYCGWYANPLNKISTLLHGEHHYDNIKHFKNVKLLWNFIPYDPDDLGATATFEKIKEVLENLTK